MHLQQSPSSQPGHVDGGVLCWIVPPVVQALEAAATTLAHADVDLAKIDAVRRSLREVRGALEIGRVRGAATTLAAIDGLLTQPDAHGRDGRALARDACDGLREYVGSLCGGFPQHPELLRSVERALLSRVGAHDDFGSDSGPVGEGAHVSPQVVASIRAQRDRLRRLQELWERCAAGDSEGLAPFRSVLRDLIAEGLPDPLLDSLAASVQRCEATVAEPAALPPPIAMALATALLFIDDALAVWPELGASLAMQVDALDRWLAETATGGGPAVPGVDLQQEAHRREQERALAARLSAELAGLVRSVEHHMLAFFEDGAARDALSAATVALARVRGVLTLLADAAGAAVAGYCAQRIGEWLVAQEMPDAGVKSEVGATVCALEYYVEQIAFGATDLQAILQRAGVSEAVLELAVARQPQPTPEQQSPDPIRVADGEQDGGVSAAEVEMAEAGARTALPDAPIDTPADGELAQIFLEEAAEVMRTLREELSGLREEPGNATRLAVVRRGYHTLKGSGRMVGLTQLGEAAWAIEQVLNGVVQQAQGASSDLLRLLELAQERFEQWIARLGADGHVAVDAARLAEWAERIRRGEQLPVEAVVASPAEATVHDAEPMPAAADPIPERTVEIGGVRISPALFSTFVAEATRHLSTLHGELEAMRGHPDGAASYESFRAAHTLAGIAGTTGLRPVSQLAGELERVLQLLYHRPRRLIASDMEQLLAARGALESMLSAIARSETPAPATDLAASISRLADRLLAESGGLQPMHGLLLAAQAPQESAASREPQAMGTQPESGDEPGLSHTAPDTTSGERRRGRIIDDLDKALLPVFLEEAADLVPQIGQVLRDWRAQPDEDRHPEVLQRLLHTLKGSARMAGAMALGELTHSVETRVADAAERGSIPERVFDSLYVSFDRMGVLLEELERGQTEASLERTQLLRVDAVQPSAAPALLRVRAELVDRLVDEAGEVTIARARMETDMRTLRSALRDLTESVIRLRGQVREVEIQAETQMESRLAQAKQADEQFDPLEFDRFTRLQELTRFLAESVSDVTALQQSIVESVDAVEAALAAQRTAARAVQDGLMRVRLIPIATLTERLYRVTRLTAREAGKRVNLEVRGAGVELERGVMERIAGPIEHLLRNAIVHGVEMPDRRHAFGKPETGMVVLAVRQEGNEVVLTLSDDGAGLDLPRIRSRAITAGLVAEDAHLSDEDTAQLIFAQGLSTSEQLTQAAGRGVGLDVVRNEIGSLGGRIQLSFEAGKGTTFTIYLPVTLSVMQAVLVNSADQTFALPTLMVEQVQKVKPDTLVRLFHAGELEWQGHKYPLYDLQRLLGNAEHVPTARRYNALVLLRSGEIRAAVHVDELLGSQEIIVKNMGSQLARVAGIAGAAVLGSGENVLILNPVMLTQSLGGGRPLGEPLRGPLVSALAAAEAARPIVMIVDDSLTIRRVTGRLLARAGYDVVEARDGVEAMEKLRSVLPRVMVIDIEMPRMDGFELTRCLRDDPRLRQIPLIVVSSRTADKHRQYAAELGVNLFLGKPYQEDVLLGHVASFVAGAPDAAVSA